MLLFVDFDGVLHPLAVAVGERRGLPYTGPPLAYAPDLVEALGPHLPCVDIVISSTWARTRTLGELRSLLPDALATRVTATIWDRPPPRPLSRYEHIRFWLAYTYVRRAPAWFALDDDDRGWPADQRKHLIHCAAPINTPQTKAELRTTLGRYLWPEVWWGDGEPPAGTDIRRAFCVMLDWQVPLAARPQLLGRTRAEFEARLDLLLAINAAPQPPRDSQLTWPWQWLRFPCKDLQGERPMDVMSRAGVEGMKRVLTIAWALDALDPTSDADVSTQS